MRILVVSQYFWPENFRINELVKEWTQREHEVVVLTGKPNYPIGKVFGEYTANPNNFDTFANAAVIRVPVIARGNNQLKLSLNYMSFVFSGIIFGLWKLRKMKFDVIFVYEPSPVTVGLPAIWLSYFKKTPVVFWVLDLWPDTLSAVGVIRSPLLLGWIGKLVHYIYERCTLILGQSRGFMESIANYCDNNSKIRYFPSWCEEMLIQGNVNPATEVSAMEKCFTVLFAGNIGEAQDMPAVLDAAEELKDISDIRWVIVGDGRRKEWLEAQVVKRGLQECVLMPGRFPIERMPSFYEHADALLVSLKRDPVFEMTIPGKVQNCLMTGIPLLGMLDGEGSMVIREAQAGLTCNAGDGVALAQKVLELKAISPEMRQLMGRNGQIYAEREFGRNQLMDRMDSYLNEAIEKVIKRA